MPDSDTRQLFIQQYEKLAGKVYIADSVDSLVSTLHTIIFDQKARTLVTTPEFTGLAIQPIELLSGKNFPDLQISYCDQQSPAEIDRADIGLSTAVFAIAFTGAIVEVSTNDAGRLVSSLPRVHVALLPASQIVPALEDAAPRLRQIYRGHPQHCNITFISGPSRTADIEMRLFLGVHGPQAAYVVLCDF